MKTHYFTCGRLMEILTELEAITDNELFTKHIFNIIHREIMKVSYLHVHNIEHETFGTNILIEGLDQAKHDAKERLLKFCYSLKGTETIAQDVLSQVDYAKQYLEAIKERRKEVPFWQIRMHYYLWKRKQSVVKKQIPFHQIGNLFLYLYIKRGIGNSLSFSYDLIAYSRHRSKGKKTEDKKKKGFSFKNPFRKVSTVTGLATRSA